MLDLNATLDNLIAMVVVILALSLVVQAVQSAVKKVFKLKSRQIEDSLAHLFQFVIDNQSAAAVKPDEEKPSPLWATKWKGFKAVIEQSPFLRIFVRLPHPAEDKDYPDAGKLFNEVLNNFRAIGRTAFSTRPIFDSLSKGDLLKVIANIDPNKVDKDFSPKFAGAVTEFRNLSAAFLAWEEWFNGPEFKPDTILSPDDKAKLAALQSKLRPLVSSLRLRLTGQTTTGQALQSLTKDVAQLRAIKLDDVQSILDDVLANITNSAERARLDQNEPVAKGLTLLVAKLTPLSNAFASFRQTYNAVFANWVKLEESFDSVMQSFEERYTRGMKTAAIFISLFVVVFLNANFFNIYRQIATSDATREMVIQSRQGVVDAIARNLPPAAPTPENESPEERKTREGRERADQEQTVQSWLRASREEIRDSADAFIGYGFQPLKWSDFTTWLDRLFHPPDRIMVIDRAGNRREVSPWWTARKDDVKTLLGWLIMMLLLSVGAPFWQDFLESLFGVKNVLRKRSDTKNIEQEPGTGQPRQS